MLKKALRFLAGTDLNEYQAEIDRQNRLAIQYLIAAGIPVSFASIAAQTIIKGAPTLLQNGCWMLVYFLLLALANAFLIPEKCRHTTLLVYLLQAPVLLIAILLGTVWDPGHQALTYLMFMVLMPAFLLDKPYRVILVMAGWNLLFLLLGRLTKDPATLPGDMLHTLEFYFSSIAVTLTVLRLRFAVIRGYNRSRYAREHDGLTDAQNRQSLEARLENYLGKPLLLVMGDLDQMTLLNDFYGREFGDRVLLSFSTVLQESFGKDAVYRFGGDEMLCVLPGWREEDCLPLLERCREKMAAEHEERQPYVTCSFSTVSGCPANAEAFRNMIQLAEIQVHKAGKLNPGSTSSFAFDEAVLRASIVETNINTHLQAYETNKLTGLPSVEYFISHCEEMLDSLIKLEQRPVIGLINILRLHSYNDAWGYAKGDELVRELVRLLHEAYPNRHLGYLTSGRFCVMCYLAEAEPGIRLINEALRRSQPAAAVEVKAGFAEYSPGDSVISLLDRARLSHNSIYAEKDRHFCLYDDKLDEERRFRQYLVTHLDEAIENGWIKVFYQPIVRAVTGEICNLEALSRWDDPVYGFLQPARFIPALEEERIIYRLNLHVVHQILRHFRQLEAQGLPLVPVSVNLSRRDFSECDMVGQITALMDAAGRPRALLKIEITESAFMENPTLLKREVDRFHANGFEVWMDDFGSEYSTLNLLHELNFDLIKIDMQFMKNFSAAGRNSIIIDDLIGMAKRLGVTTLVEGVETREHFDALRRLGSEKLQGYYFARPLPPEELQRAILRGELPKLEQGSLAGYYAELGRINLHSPLSGSPAAGQSIPAGIVELKGESCRLVRGNEALHLMAQERTAFPIAESRPVALAELPAVIARALRAAQTSETWSCIHDKDIHGQPVSFYGRRISESPEGAIAALLVILPG